MKRIFIFLALVFAVSLSAQDLVFSGTPKLKVYQDSADHYIEQLSAAKAAEYRCEIRKIGDKYYWTSRESKELVQVGPRIGAFITFAAKDGSGYVRIVLPYARKAFAGIPAAANTDAKFHYMEHLVFLLSTYTYYGTALSDGSELQ